MVLVAALGVAGASAHAAAQPAARVVRPAKSNEVALWCPGGLGIKYEPVSTPFVVPAPPTGWSWTLLVLKAGSGPNENATFPNPVVGQGYRHPGGRDNSHAILCTTSTTVVTTTTTTPATTTPLATTTTELATTTTEVATTTTEPATTTTVAATTTIEPATTTTGAELTVPSTPRSCATSLDPFWGGPLVSWGVPASDGGSPVTGYRILIHKDGHLEGDVVVPAGVQSYSVDGTLGSWYAEVTAVNQYGPGEACQTNVFLIGQPTASAPTACELHIEAAAGSTGDVSVTWDAPVSDGGFPVTGYRVVVFKDDNTDQAVIVPAGVQSWSVDGSAGLWFAAVWAVNQTGPGESCVTNDVTIP
jgi:hypothetical protein